jgi:hypothetical protein
MAAVPMAFIGWIGTGVLKAKPTMILKRPKLTRTPNINDSGHKKTGVLP